LYNKRFLKETSGKGLFPDDEIEQVKVGLVVESEEEHLEVGNPQEQ